MLKLLDISKFKESTNIIYGITKSDEKKWLEEFTPDENKVKNVLEGWNWSFHKWHY